MARRIALLFAAFGALLALAGLYGVLYPAVNQGLEVGRLNLVVGVLIFAIGLAVAKFAKR